METMAEQFDLPALEEFTVEAGRPDCTDEEKLRIIKEYGATRISINPQTFSDEVLRNMAAATRRRISWIVTGPPAAWGMITSTWT